MTRLFLLSAILLAGCSGKSNPISEPKPASEPKQDGVGRVVFRNMFTSVSRFETEDGVFYLAKNDSASNGGVCLIRVK